MEHIIYQELTRIEGEIDDLQDEIKELVNEPHAYYAETGKLPFTVIESRVRSLKTLSWQEVILKTVLGKQTEGFLQIDMTDNTADEFRKVVKHNGRKILDIAIETIISAQNERGRFLDGEETVATITETFDRYFDVLY
jgi:hypothetical protein